MRKANVSFRRARQGDDLRNSNGGDKRMRNFRQWIRELLEEFIASEENELKLEPMTSEERRIAHIMARKLDLRSVSRGKEPERYMTIKRSRTRGGIFSCLSMNETQTLILHDEQKEEIKKFISHFPIEHHHIDDHFALPDHKRKQKRDGHIGPYRSQKLVPPLTNMSQDIEQFRMSLPTYRFRKDVLNAIEKYSVTLITGGTGCGKTTQIPQFILEEAYATNTQLRIMCTQPRRLPAIAVSKRVAVERGERLGSTVGYHIRLEQKTSAETVLTYCTSGVLLRMLTVDELVNDMTHIILDEIHEREQNTDYLLIALKQALRTRKDLKVILMSATMEGNLSTFMNYFDSTAVGYVNIPSRLYNVEKFDLADVLSLTGYMPHSMFGGLFSASIGLSRNQPYDTFPTVSEFRSEENFLSPSMYCNGNNNDSFHQHYQQEMMPSVRTEPNLADFYNAPNSSMLPGYNGHIGRSPKSNNHSRSPDVFDDSGLFGQHSSSHQPFSFRQPRTMDEMEKHLDRFFPNRPPYFDPSIIGRLRKADFNRNALIATYLNSGGQQWADGVDVDLTVELIRYLANSNVDGSILVFLPGYDDIVQVRDQMSTITEKMRVKPVVFTLHSQINTQEQQKVFEKVPFGSRKVILSTNIAEASLTINDVVFVVDCGKVKEKTYDYTTRITQLKVAWIAKSNAEQRAGRAGRCRNGYCFRLYSRREYESMLDTQVPEMRRAAIHDVCLHAKMFAPENMPVKKFLEMAPEPPLALAVDHSMEFLEKLGALYTDKEKLHQTNERRFNNHCNYINNNTQNSIPAPLEFYEAEMTELGKVLAHLPLDPQLARLLLFGLALKCFNPVVTLVASLSHRDPFVLPIGDDRTAALKARDEFARRDFSDHLMLIRAFYAYTAQYNRQYNFCRANFLSPQTMKMIYGIRRQLILELKRLRFLPPNVNNHDDPEVNTYSNCWPMIQGAIVAGCYPGIGFVKAGSKLRKIRTNTDVNASLHPSSVIKRQITNVNKRWETYWGWNEGGGDPVIEYLAYQELSRIDEGLTLRMVTVVPPLSVLLFAGPIRTSREIIENFEIAEEDIPPELLKKNSRLGEAPAAKKGMDKRSLYGNRNHMFRCDGGCGNNYDHLPTERVNFSLGDSTPTPSYQNDNKFEFLRETKSNGNAESDQLAAKSSLLASIFEVYGNGPPSSGNRALNEANKAELEAKGVFRPEETSSTSIIVEDVGIVKLSKLLDDLNTADLKKIGDVKDGDANTNNCRRLPFNAPEASNSGIFDLNKASSSSLHKNGSNSNGCSSIIGRSSSVDEGNITMPKGSFNHQNNNQRRISNNDGQSWTQEQLGWDWLTADKEKCGVQGCATNAADCSAECGLEEEVDDIDEEDDDDKEYVLELESWLAFKGSFDTMQSLARLRFKLMSYFLAVLKNPARETSEEDMELLECLRRVLTSDHKKHCFNECTDLPRQKQRNRQFYEGNNSGSDFASSPYNNARSGNGSGGGYTNETNQNHHSERSFFSGYNNRRKE